MVVLMMACKLASIPTPVQAQEVSSVVEDRVEPGADVPPMVPADSEVRSGGLDLGAVLAVAYDTNIFLSRARPVADTVSRLGVALAYTQGDSKAGEGGFIQFAYRSTAVMYAENHSESRIDHQVAVIAGWRGKALGITYTGGARKLGDATADTGQQADRAEFENELRAAWFPRDKVAVELAAGHRQSDYSDPALVDSSKTYGEAALRYAYSSKTAIGLAYQAGRFQVDGAGNQTTHQVTAEVDWQPREKIHLNLEAGAEHRKTENGSEVNPVVEARVDWTPRQGTSLYLTCYQREEASAFYASQNYNLKGVTAGVSQRLGGKWTARLEGGRESASYSQVAGSGASGRKDAIWFLRPALEYGIADAVKISLFYRVAENRSTASEFGYDQEIAGVELNYQF